MSFVEHIADVSARVDARGPRRWLFRGVWPGEAYGVMAAEKKAQKTWNGVDAAVSVASGTPWLGHFEVDDPGPVVYFIGEGGEANMVRRLRAVCDERGLVLEDLPIYIRARAPHLKDDEQMEEFTRAVSEILPKLTEIDPFYLAAGGANPSSLVEMGQLLERPQQVCEAAESALLVIHHFNRGQGSGADRISGAGPAEWGRVLISIDVVSRYTDTETSATTVTTKFDIIGGEIPDQEWNVKRHIAADDPDDLDSPMRYSVEVFPAERRGSADGAVPPARRKVIEALQAGQGTVKDLGDRIADRYGVGLKHATIERHLTEMAEAGLADSYGEGWSVAWFLSNVEQEAA